MTAPQVSDFPRTPAPHINTAEANAANDRADGRGFLGGLQSGQRDQHALNLNQRRMP